ncbi:hypothetical protein [Actinomadura sp. WMMA1423]|uniref:hypothetical protein n=1 Tax=Actinomadura sp. WMMA1423 TaxID=2591108 RepID=UPI001146439B|nr:hypothetical protein [Actinomadura sp. WMMA1423]
MSTLAELRASLPAATCAAIQQAARREVAEHAPAPTPQHIARLAPLFAGEVDHILARHGAGRQHTTAA